MTDPTPAIATSTAVQQLLDAGAISTTELYADSTTADAVLAVVPTDYQLKVADLTNLRASAPAPRRTTGTATVTDTASFLAYFGKHSTEDSEVFGDVTNSTVVAILNAPGEDVPAWGDHRVVLQLKHSAAWQAWISQNGLWLSQTDFAEHLEDRTPDLVQPDASTMLELAQSFQATTGVQFESGSQLHSGQRRFTYLETVEGKAGNRGQIDIPTSIKIMVPVWRGVDIVVPMTARFRFRTGQQGLKLGFVLDRLDDVLDAAWESLLAELTATITIPVLSGKAPSYR